MLSPWAGYSNERFGCEVMQVLVFDSQVMSRPEVDLHVGMPI